MTTTIISVAAAAGGNASNHNNIVLNGAGAVGKVRKTILYAGRAYHQCCRTASTGEALGDGVKATKARKIKEAKSKERKWLRRYQKSIVNQDFLSLTMYQQMGISALGFSANEADIKTAYHRVLIEHHPDKTGRTENDPSYLAVQKAFLTLMDPTKRRAYDSQCDFDEAIPSGKEHILQNDMTDTGGDGGGNGGLCFYDVYRPVFERNARFSVDKNVPGLGDDDTDISQVYDFYDFWLKFDSWRDFSHDAEHDVDSAEHRDEKRFLMKKILVKTKKMKKAEYTRLTSLTDSAMANDPRIKREKHSKKQAKIDAKKQEEEKAVKLFMEAQTKNAEEAKIKEEQELKKKNEAKSVKLDKDKAKKLLRKAKKLFRELMEAARIKNDASVLGVSEIETLCDALDLQEIQALSKNMGGSVDSLDLKGVVQVNTRFSEL